ncbi:MAG TPA: hypothetical protein DCZ95_17045 [Verrucomicrobia bacterium]|nr:MAG: hypothetical protein A2X46_09530 [Lentisphaerae bacterium GWF2_57_35]HBA85792.1 hypothetical protein [Verrucomicrobiota bacterium]
MGFRGSIESLLKKPERLVCEISRGRAGATASFMGLAALICLAAYGLTAGMFSWGDQLWAAPLKIMLGVFFSALICLPSLFIFSCLSGSEAGLAETGAILAGTLGLLALLLLGFAPVSWIFAQSTDSIVFMGLLHLFVWGIAFRYAMGFLHRAFGLLNSSRKHHLVIWSVVFALVLLQMSTTLRPILGTSDRFLQTEKKSFFTHWGDCLKTGGKATK